MTEIKRAYNRKNQQVSKDADRVTGRPERRPLDVGTPMQDFLRKHTSDKRFEYFAALEGTRSPEDMEAAFYEQVLDSDGKPVVYSSKGEKFHLYRLLKEYAEEDRIFHREKTQQTLSDGALQSGNQVTSRNVGSSMVQNSGQYIDISE